MSGECLSMGIIVCITVLKTHNATLFKSSALHFCNDIVYNFVLAKTWYILIGI